MSSDEEAAIQVMEKGSRFGGVNLVFIILPAVLVSFLAIVATTVVSIINGVAQSRAITDQLRAATLENAHTRAFGILTDFTNDCTAMSRNSEVRECVTTFYDDLLTHDACVDSMDMMTTMVDANGIYSFNGAYTLVNGTVMSGIEVTRDLEAGTGVVVAIIDSIENYYYRAYEVFTLPPAFDLDVPGNEWYIEQAVWDDPDYPEFADDWFESLTGTEKGIWIDYVWPGYEQVYAGYAFVIELAPTDIPSTFKYVSANYDLGESYMYEEVLHNPVIYYECSADTTTLQNFLEQLAITPSTKTYMINSETEELLATSTTVYDVADFVEGERYTAPDHPSATWITESWALVKDHASTATENGDSFSAEYGGSSFMGKGGKLVDSTVLVLDGAKWVIVMVNDNDDFYETQISSTELIMSVSICVFIVATAIMAFISALITRPIRALNSAMAALQRLEFESPKLVQKSGALNKVIAEVSSMQVAFNGMSVAIRSFSRFAPLTIIEKLVRSGQVVQKEMRNRFVSIFFSDMEGFTKIAECVTPDVLIDMLDDYLTSMSEEIVKQEGMVVEYIGDAIMACWNCPEYVDDHSTKILTSGINQQRALGRLNDEWSTKFGKTVRARIGMHSGECLQGIFGSRSRLKYGLAGDNVNLCARVESIAKKYGLYTLCTGEALDNANREKFLVRQLDRVIVKGRSEPTDLYEVVNFAADATPDETQMVADWQSVMEAYFAQDWKSAANKLDYYEKMHGTVAAVGQLRSRLEDYEAHPELTGPSWNRAHVFSSK